MNLIAERLRLKRNAGRDGRTAEDTVPAGGGTPPNAFGFGMVAAVISAAIKRALGGREVSPRGGGARLDVTGGMSREAAQDFGGSKSPEVKE